MRGGVLSYADLDGTAPIGIPPMIAGLISFVELIIYRVKSDRQFHDEYVVGDRRWL